MRSGGCVTQDGAVAEREHRGQCARLSWKPRLTDGVNPAVKGMETAEPKPMVDRASAEAKALELCARNQPVLPRGNTPDRPLDLTRLSFTLYFNVNLRRVGHAGQGGAASVTRG
jgi:hypothetical protein